MSKLTVYRGARVFDGEGWHDDAALVVSGTHVQAILAVVDAPPEAETIDLDGGFLVPGFVDLQVNGGGGVLFNEHPDAQGIATICAAHARFGTTALLPTLISDTPEVTDRALAAGVAATRAQTPGLLGLHMEGPHLALARKGAHAPTMLRPMEDADVDRLLAAHSELPNLLTTLAPEVVDPQRIARLAGAGIVVSLGHSDADYLTATGAAAAGASMVTHLFNAMSPLGHRKPGMVGAALETGSLHAGLIADGYHVDKATMGIALRAKRGPGHIFLVTDAMSPIGTDMQSFTLNGRRIHRAEGCLRLEDGTLAGADLTMIDAIGVVHRTLGLPLAEALRMASLYPARALGVAAVHGHLGPGARADMVHLDADLTIRSVRIANALAHAA